ncbi:MAG: lysophospholipid acyltransferase family protein [Gemmatimonadaceae bacterium]
MLYLLIRWIATVALRWFYRGVEVDGLERIPASGPVLLTVNHPNALVDVLAVTTALRRRVTLTGKAVLFDNPALRFFLPRIGFVPLRRAKDEAPHDPASPVDASRNAEAFRAIHDALGKGAAVLIFPEGISHNDPSLAPLKTGAARIALQARDERGIHDLSIVPVGLTFELKWRPRTRIFIHVGEPIALDAWRPSPEDAAATSAEHLTREIDTRLRALTLNFPTADEAERILGVARLLAGVFDEPRPLDAPDPPLGEQMRIVRRIEHVRDTLPAAASVRARHFLDRLEALRVTLARRAIVANEIGLSPALRHGAIFAVREGAIIALLGPVAWWGRINHWIPIAFTRTLARHRSTSPEDPAMNTLVIGVFLVLAAYAAQAALVWHWAGARWALIYLLSLPAAATWDLRFRDRMTRARQRMRTYFRFRRDPALKTRLLTEVQWLRAEAIALETITDASSLARR